MALENLGEYAAKVALELTTALPAGIVCVLDERDLNLPGALLSLDYDAGTFDKLDKETLTITWKVYLIEREQNPVTALARLGVMLNAIQKTWGIIDTFHAEAIPLPNHAADPLPSFSFTFQDELPPRKDTIMKTKMIMGPGVLEIGEPGAIANLARRCTSVTLTPSVDRGEPRYYLSGDTDAGDRSETWVLSGNLDQDYGLPESTWEFLFNHRGQPMPFRFQPDKTAGAPIGGNLIVEAVALGGDVNTKPGSDFEFPLVGEPVLGSNSGTWTPPTGPEESRGLIVSDDEDTDPVIVRVFPQE